MCPRYSGSTEEKLLWRWRGKGEEDRASEDRGQAGKAGRRGNGMDNSLESWAALWHKMRRRGGEELGERGGSDYGGLQLSD